MRRPSLIRDRETPQRVEVTWGELRLETRLAAVMALQQQRSHSWARIGRLGTVGTVQYTGSDPGTAQLSGVIVLGGWTAWEQVQRAGRSTEAHTLLVSSGRGESTTRRVLGYYVITDVQAEVQQLLPSGELRAASWTLSLLEVPGGAADRSRQLDETAQGGQEPSP